VTGCAVVGIGTIDRGDDGIGLLVAERVRAVGASGVTVVPVASPVALLDVFERYDDVVVVDAVRSGAEAGTVTVTTVDESPLPGRTSGAGTHGFGVADAIELARALDRLPARLVVVGIELARVTTGAGVTEAVADAVDQAAHEVLRTAQRHQ
jgi:hydrogenase maturation protease